MLTNEADSFINDEIIGRFPTAIIKAAKRGDWKRILKKLSWQQACDAIQRCADEANTIPTISKFASIAHSISSVGSEEVEPDGYVMCSEKGFYNEGVFFAYRGAASRITYNYGTKFGGVWVAYEGKTYSEMREIQHNGSIERNRHPKKQFNFNF
jgi:hypothetical protein